jgi:hypothetical protein
VGFKRLELYLTDTVYDKMMDKLEDEYGKRRGAIGLYIENLIRKDLKIPSKEEH